jgi:signal transduction histidine kinase
MQRPGSSDRVVFMGFAGLLILMSALAFDSARQMRDVTVRSSALRKESRDHDALLDQVRTDSYRLATLVRDYVLESDESRADSQKAELLALRSHIEEALNRYAANAPRGEEQAIGDLREHARSYWDSFAMVLDWRGSARRQQGETILRTTIVPKRDGVVQFVKQVSALDNRTLDAAEERIQLMEERFRSRVSAISILALLLGIALAAAVVYKVKRLGAEAASQFNEVQKTKEDWKRLSDRLVAVQEDERRKVSRELHDDLGQAMSAMLMELTKAESAPPGSQRLRDELAAVRKLAEENVVKVRNMALLLRPAMLDELGLVPALRWHVREVARRSGLKVRLIADELDDDLPDSSRTCIYRVVQEALNNCVKHAQAKEVRVVMQRDGQGLTIAVHDDGVGFDPERNKGLGLLGMMERVSVLGGRFYIESQPGLGTVLSTFIPVESERCSAPEESVA